MLNEKMEFLQQRWWLLPAVVVVGGHVVSRATRHKNIGASVKGAGGAMGYYNYKLHQASVAASATETRGVQETSGAQEDFDALRSLPETSGVQDMPSMESAASRLKVA